MKVVHLKDDGGDLTEHSDWIIHAKIHERNNEFPKAVTAWKKVINAHKFYVQGYDRLMINYRKLKDYKSELAIIEKALKVFTEHYAGRQPSFSNKVITLSKSLLKATGLGDRKGNSVYQPGEITRWNKRKAVVEKRLKSSRK